MMVALDIILRLAVWLLLAPLLPGIINKVKAWVAGRRGPPVLQLYFDLAKLWHKGVVLSTAVSPAHVIGPAMAWIAIHRRGACCCPSARRARRFRFAATRCCSFICWRSRGFASHSRRSTPVRPLKAWAWRAKSATPSSPKPRSSRRC